MKGIFMTNNQTSRKFLWDEKKVRYRLTESNPSVSRVYNWLFFPGGPGIDSSYFSTLTPKLNLPGNIWYIDFPNNGSNLIKNSDVQNFDAWLEEFVPIISRFSNPIYIGHSFAGMLPLLYPELENYLKGLVLITTAPKLWFAASAEMGKKLGLPDLTAVLEAYMHNPNTDTFTTASKAFAQYYFTQEFLKEGLALLENTAANPFGPYWWMRKVQATNYSAEWIPKKVPTMIIGGREDAVMPFSLFLEDKRFQRKNIQLAEVPDVAHFPWFGNMKMVQDLFTKFINQLI